MNLAETFREPSDDKPPPLTPIPSLDLVRALQVAVTRSVDEDESALVALEKLQTRVLLAVARFEASQVIL